MARVQKDKAVSAKEEMDENWVFKMRENRLYFGWVLRNFIF